jgi:hypothetical protein
LIFIQEPNKNKKELFLKAKIFAAKIRLQDLGALVEFSKPACMDHRSLIWDR